MGNLLPDICVCKEREGKDKRKKKPRLSIIEENLSLVDYTGLLHPAKTLNDVKSKIEAFTIYEISSVRNVQSGSKHSDVKLKCFSPDMSLIYIKISFITSNRPVIRVYYLSEEDEEGLLEYNFKYKFESKITYKSNLKLLIHFLQETGKLNENESENQGKVVYNYLKKVMEKSQE